MVILWLDQDKFQLIIVSKIMSLRKIQFTTESMYEAEVESRIADCFCSDEHRCYIFWIKQFISEVKTNQSRDCRETTSE